MNPTDHNIKIQEHQFSKHGFVIATVLLLTCLGLRAQDWSSCASDLDYLRRQSEQASSLAEEIDSKHKRLKSAENELQQCLSAPQIFDLLRDGCRSKRFEYESAKSNYKVRLDFFRGSLDNVDSKIRSVSNSCGLELTRSVGTSPTVPAGVKKPERCAIYLRYKDRLPAQALLDTCSKQMPAEECRKCLN
ncbi:hypothetical protein [Leptothrix ochracea]|uniref:hypothetical protein n=1 Tax=Leptothrix ochracea TaxID=735331 RepID=UPI0034E23C4B